MEPLGEVEIQIRLQHLKREIQRWRSQERRGLQARVKIGDALIAIRDHLGTGFRPWLRTNLTMNQLVFERYEGIATTAHKRDEVRAAKKAQRRAEAKKQKARIYRPIAAETAARMEMIIKKRQRRKEARATRATRPHFNICEVARALRQHDPDWKPE